MYNIKSRRYLGSKARLLNFIEDTVKKNCSNIHSFCDLFAGTGCVGWIFNNSKTKVILNDMLECNHVSYVSFFSNEKIDIDKLSKIVEFYNSLNVVDDNYFSENFSNTFFSEENCKKIGFIREDIEKLYKNKKINYRERCYLITSLIYSMDRIANTVGHYDAYRLKGDLSKKISLELLEIPLLETNENNEIYCEDANVLVNRIYSDLVYIDPPYNSRQYCDAYHLLENVARWEKPTVYGVARKMDRSRLKSKYCMKSAPKQFEDLISKINAKYILVSYNNMGNKGANRSQAKITDSDIINTLQKRGRVEIFETDFQQFTTGKTNVNDHKERLFLCFVGDKSKKNSVTKDSNTFVKSPLNYTGGKYKLLPQLIDKFPKKITTFVDLFGGGFNVGSNIEAQFIVYNDKQKEVMKVVKLFKKYDSIEICNKIEKIINRYELSNTNDHGYEYYGCNSDSGIGSYNKNKYERLRTDYNNFPNENDEKYFLLLTLIIYSFNNQIRFNSKCEFNMPVGKRDFNNNVRKNVKLFANKINNLNIDFMCKSFNKVDVINMKDPFVYCDPPYYLGTASYNENDGWSENDEKKLLNYLLELDKNNIKFALSNVIEHKGKTHSLLRDWVEKNHFNLIYIKSNYSNSSYQLKDKNTITREVLITNY